VGERVPLVTTPTGVPSLCILEGNEAYLGPLRSQRVRPHFHAWERDWFTRVEACGRCEAAEACMGVPKTYVALFGDAEFHPLRWPVRT